MRRFLLCWLTGILAISLAGCMVPLPNFMTTPQLQEVQINGVVYKTGFYEGHHITLDVLSVENCGKTDAGHEYAQVEGTPFDLIWTLEYGYYGTGAIYCREDQWDTATAYYADVSNYDYKLFEGNAADMEADLEYAMPDLDVEKYRALKEFEAEFAFGPAMSDVEAPRYEVTLPSKDRYVGELYFQVISKDGYFVENYGQRYRVADGKLVIIYQYWMEKGTVDVIEVPKELSDYFLQFITGKSRG